MTATECTQLLAPPAGGTWWAPGVEGTGSARNSVPDFLIDVRPLPGFDSLPFELDPEGAPDSPTPRGPRWAPGALSWAPKGALNSVPAFSIVIRSTLNSWWRDLTYGEALTSVAIALSQLSRASYNKLTFMTQVNRLPWRGLLGLVR